MAPAKKSAGRPFWCLLQRISILSGLWIAFDEGERNEVLKKMIMLHMDLQKLEISGKSIIIYPFYKDFSFVELVRVCIFLESMSVKPVQCVLAYSTAQM